MKRIINLILSAFLILSVCAQPQDMKKQLDNYFRNYRAFGQLIRTSSKLQDIKVNDTLRTIEVIADSHFGEQVFTPKSAEDIYEAVGKIAAGNPFAVRVGGKLLIYAAVAVGLLRDDQRAGAQRRRDL